MSSTSMPRLEPWKSGVTPGGSGCCCHACAEGVCGRPKAPGSCTPGGHAARCASMTPLARPSSCS
eukprot:11800659-Alexandrium_andersonii.AAC.1